MDNDQKYCVRWNSHLGSLGAAFPEVYKSTPPPIPSNYLYLCLSHIYIRAAPRLRALHRRDAGVWQPACEVPSSGSGRLLVALQIDAGRQSAQPSDHHSADRDPHVGTASSH